MNLDLHVHSMYSYDGYLRPEHLIKIARKRHLDGIAVTDHNTVKGGLRTRAIAPEGFTVIPGAEIKTEKGEVIGLFVAEEIRSRIFEDVRQEILDQGGAVVLPHPYRNKKYNPESLIGSVDIVEAVNARTSGPLNEKARILARKYSKPIIGGSDAHNRLEIGRVYTMIPGNTLSDKNDIFREGIEIVGSEFPKPVRLLGSCIGKIIKEGRIFRPLPRD